MAVAIRTARGAEAEAVAEASSAPTGSGALSLRDIHHTYGRKGAAVLSGVGLEVESGEVVALLGPSGCGKTTLLRIVAGLIRPSSGRVIMAGRDLTRVATHKRNIGLVHQNFALWPHLTVAENVAFGLDMRRKDRAVRKSRVAEMLELVGLSGYEGRFPRQLSGGQQQRVALARALAFEPTVLLLDEPLSALDANLRHQLQAHLRHLQRTTGVTTVIVTHDREEAMGVSNRIVVLDRGRVQQVAAAPELYREPVSPFVMRFTGECNLIDGTVDHTGAVVVAGFGKVASAPRPLPDGTSVTVGFRPEAVQVVDRPDGSQRAWTGCVRDAAFLGPFATYEITVDGGPVVTARCDTASRGVLPTVGSPIAFTIPEHALRVFPHEEN